MFTKRSLLWTEDSGGVQDADAEETGLAEGEYAKFMLQMNYYFI